MLLLQLGFDIYSVLNEIIFLHGLICLCSVFDGSRNIYMNLNFVEIKGNLSQCHTLKQAYWLDNVICSFVLFTVVLK